ncbi:hypothetical protein G9A89_023205 [Geosiphon pyriformis]|nr:hypothetical protein G9A89_023205 [Geosiphon pyriformis]
MNPSESLTPNYRQIQNGSSTVLSEGSKSESVPHTDSNGIQYRPQQNGRVIPRGEILSRIVPFYELFITNSALLGYHILKGAVKHISSNNGTHIFLFEACQPIHYQPDVDLCAASALTWSLMGGAVLYFVITSLIGFFIYLECRRKDYPATFTALWNSPLFIACYFFQEKQRIDLLSIPNRFMHLRKWTHSHVHRLIFSLYCLITTSLIAHDLTRRTVDQNDFDANKASQGKEFYSHIYNPYFLPYYVAIYLYLKTIIASSLEIRGLLFNDKPEKVGVHFMALKSR